MCTNRLIVDQTNDVPKTLYHALYGLQNLKVKCFIVAACVMMMMTTTTMIILLADPTLSGLLS
jgi:hypothetical protein